MATQALDKAFQLASERYGELGVDVEGALTALSTITLSLHCWQADDVGGFEATEGELGGGLAVTGNYPGKARTVEELRADLTMALSLIPGRHRVNLHAIYGEFGGKKVDRDAIGPEHFAGWIDWARAQGVGLDFNATCFSHALAADGFTLSNRDSGVRAFWIEHVKRCREIGAAMGRELGTPAVHNLWIPDGAKDETPDRLAHRQWLMGSLAAIYAEDHAAEHLKDSVESKLFGIGSEAFVVGSFEFYLAWALANKKMICLDMGHFHPTESVADKVGALLLFFPELLFHVSRGLRWDSDHVVTFNDELRALMLEIVRARALNRAHLALDYFDASLNRVGAYVIGARATLKALLYALLEPTAKLREFEADGDNFSRLALLEEMKTLPFGAVWDMHCARAHVPPAEKWLADVQLYECRVLRDR
ncbi:MAG TPA: L-rhamnose isomerase [bacterium]|nr:L-rhamnose isomerase [bacterium]